MPFRRFTLVLTALGALVGVATESVSSSGPASAAIKVSSSSPLHAGTFRFTLSWDAKKSGATFRGDIGKVVFHGISVQPVADAANLVISGTLGTQKLELSLSTSFVGSKISLDLKGKVGYSTLSITGTVRTSTSSPSGFGDLSLLGTLGRLHITGSVYVPVGGPQTVKGTLTVR